MIDRPASALARASSMTASGLRQDSFCSLPPLRLRDADQDPGTADTEVRFKLHVPAAALEAGGAAVAMALSATVVTALLSYLALRWRRSRKRQRRGYEVLGRLHDSIHRYNALIRSLVSFERAAECGS